MSLIGGNTLIDAELIYKKAEIKEGMKVADLGCGSLAYFSFPMVKMVGEKGQIYVVDILKTILETINRKIRLENIDNMQTVWTNLETFKATKISSGSLDVALLINTLHLSQKRADILRETIRMMKKNSKLVVVDWKETDLPFGPPSEDRVNVENLKKAGEKLGLRLDDDFSAGLYHFGLIFSKI
jgi:ubiquinone/menaquinone biosynthesis C-methylase UbiE